jgi:hypothetical protein
MCEVQAGRRPRVLATDVILDVGTSLKVIWTYRDTSCQDTPNFGFHCVEG